MSDAETAYKAAEAEIERVRANGGDILKLSGEAFTALTRLPDSIAQLTALTGLYLTDTQVSDITPLAQLTALTVLSLHGTHVSDLTPIAQLTALTQLYLRGTQVSDITPLAQLTALTQLNLTDTQISDPRPLTGLRELAESPRFDGLSFKEIPATRLDPRIAEIAEIEEPKKRASELFAYLEGWKPPVGSIERNPEPNSPTLITTKAQITQLLSNSMVSRVSALQFSSQIREALQGVPTTNGNQLPEPLQTMLEFADVLDELAPQSEPATDPLDRAKLELRIAQLEQLVLRLSQQLKDATKAREAAEALANKGGFGANFKSSAGKASGVAAVSIATVGVPTAAVYFLGVEHSLVQSFLTVMGRLPK